MVVLVTRSLDAVAITAAAAAAAAVFGRRDRSNFPPV